MRNCFPFASSGGLDASATRLSPYASNQVASRASDSASTHSSSNWFTSFRRSAELFNCVRRNACSDFFEHSSRYSNGGSGRFIQWTSVSDLGAGSRFYSLVDTVSRNKTLYVFLRRIEAQTQCGTERNSHVSASPNNCEPMKRWFARFNALPIGTTDRGRISYSISPAWESSMQRSAKESHALAQEVTGCDRAN